MKVFYTVYFVLILIGMASSQCDFQKCIKTVNGNLTLECSNQGCTEVYTGKDEEKLVKIDLSNNKITSVPSLGYTQAQHLKLSNNKIENIVTGAFAKCVNLLTLDLSHNMIASVESMHWLGLHSVVKMDLSYNKITSLEHTTFSYGTLDELADLDLSNNLIKEIQTTAFSDVRSLGSLHLDHNKIIKFSQGHFAGLTGLTEAHLNDNELSSIETDFMKDCKNLMKLYLQNNNISSIDTQAFSKLTKLSKLDLRRNKLVYLKSKLNQPSLMDVYLGGNLFKVISPLFFNDCAARKISLIGLDELTTVKDFSFANSPNLERIEISHCKQLTSIESNAFRMNNSKINALYLGSNSLTYLPASLLDWTKVDRVDLSHNPWDCSCPLQWLTKSEVKLIHPDDTRCISPIYLKDHTIKSLAKDDFGCRNSSSNMSKRPIKIPLGKKAILLYVAVLVTISLLVGASIVLLVRRRGRRMARPPDVTSQYSSLLNAEDGEERAPTVAVKDNVPEEKRKLTDPDPEDV